jgi:hypothetical protein
MRDLDHMKSARQQLAHPATLIAFLALGVALAGTAIAGQQGPGGALTRKDVVKLIRKLSNKQITNRAPGLSVAGAATAANSLALAGRGADSFASSQLEPVHLVNAAGEPAFENGWANLSAEEGFVGFWKDPFGLVHLRGAAFHSGEGGASAFVLPPSFRPTDVVSMPAGIGGGAVVTVETNGAVKPFCPGAGTCAAGLDGTAFRIG